MKTALTEGLARLWLILWVVDSFLSRGRPQNLAALPEVGCHTLNPFLHFNAVVRIWTIYS
jgi:hypothetical protein